MRTHSFCPGVPVTRKNGLFPVYTTDQLVAVGLHGGDVRLAIDPHLEQGVAQRAVHLLEKTGVVEGACAAYGIVVRRWGKATPRSLSADAAKNVSSRSRARGEGPHLLGRRYGVSP
jgi:hypothetical protein